MKSPALYQLPDAVLAVGVWILVVSVTALQAIPAGLLAGALALWVVRR